MYRVAAWLGALVVVLVLVAALASIGGPQDLYGGLGAVLAGLSGGGLVPLLYLLSAHGLGAVLKPLYCGSASRHAIQMGLGLGLLLTLSHGFGALGWLDNRAVSAILIIPGLGLLIQQLVRERPRPNVSPWLVTWLPAIALLVVAASSPPGILWNSEGRGYDALSYHLQLPQDWLLRGRIEPLEHNVYSFLPGYVESAFYHIGLVMGAKPPRQGDAGAWGMTSGDGSIILACQYLSVGIAIISAWMIASLAAGVIRNCGVDDRTTKPVAILTGAIFLSTPWTIVTGSLGYNDLCVVALGGAGVLAAMDPSLGPARRGALAGLLIGFACGAKPTALFLAAPVAGALLLGLTPPRRWPVAVACGAVCGLLALAPWLIRNQIHGGNPVFPMATGLFGDALWTDEQVTRYSAAHMHVPLVDGLGMLLAPGGKRGLLHPQWLALFPLAIAGAVVGLLRGRARRLAVILLIAFVLQICAWLLLTHVQSRFLIPLTISTAPLIALGAAMLPRRLARGAVTAAVAVQLIASVAIFGAENSGRPNQLLAFGPAALTGEAFRSSSDPAARELEPIFAQAWPQVFVNRALPPTARVYLLGEARPLYFTVPTLYNTTWDAWPLGVAMRRHPGDPAAWAAELRQQGLTHIFYNESELQRLQSSGRGWADPLVMPPTVNEFLQRNARLVRSWPEAGCALFELAPPPAGALAP